MFTSNKVRLIFTPSANMRSTSAFVTSHIALPRNVAIK